MADMEIPKGCRLFCGVAVLTPPSIRFLEGREFLSLEDVTLGDASVPVVPFLAVAESEDAAARNADVFFRNRIGHDAVCETTLNDVTNRLHFLANEGFLLYEPDDGLVQEVFLPILTDGSVAASKEAADKVVQWCHGRFGE
jgi:hypothetical protein